MDWFIRNHKWLVGFALLFGVFAYWAGFKLLDQGLLTGSEFVTLLIAATVVSLVVVFAPFIQEVSIGGSVIKLKEAKLEADESLKTLRMLSRNIRKILKNIGAYLSYLEAWSISDTA
ncbi:hypothetical protein M2404_001073 [Rheinheimera pacifica]|uniref:hypothetical protein n=1 Tax=Rheinheimera pacifica TaxID=173990 RepID=UPI0021692F42|nr:hypothetical protein [Rheinheimera pacifica]MCS4306750.1 hypothetical protein [Rheinheimera pacifica]